MAAILDHIFSGIFFIYNVWNLSAIWVKCVLEGPINDR